MIRHRLQLLALSTLGLALACSADTNTLTAPCGLGSPCSLVGTDSIQNVASVTLTLPYDTLLVGDVAKIISSATDANGRPSAGARFRYGSSDLKIATVDTVGIIRTVGLGTTTITVSAGTKSASASLTVLPKTFLQLDAGLDATCATLPLGRVYCWGLDSDGQLGTPSGDSTCFADTVVGTSVGCGITPLRVQSAVVMSQVSAGDRFTCGLSTGSRAYCWGADAFGQLGANDVQSSSIPRPVFGAVLFKSISAGGFHACGIGTDNVGYCWGADATGQLGDSLRINSTTPIPVVGVSGFTALVAGGKHSCGIGRDGVTYCWGDNGAGQLGTGADSSSRDRPVAVSGGVQFTSLTAGGTHTCALTGAGAAYCWGTTAGIVSPVPTPVAGGIAFKQLSAGMDFTCGLATNGAAFCWGLDAFGQLGNGSATGYAGAPVAVVGGLTFTSISAGLRHACAITADGAAYCWGSNVYGALGNDLQAAMRGTPVRVTTPRT